MQRITIFFIALVAFMALPQIASAHVVVKPAQVGVAAYQTFTMGVPNEKDNPTIAVRLVIPEGVKSVTPNTKPGWVITEKKEGEGETANVTEISWTGGTIPIGQRDDFLFSAQAPAAEGSLHWKAYQTYEDGTTVSWDHDPKAASGSAATDEDEADPPYSTTMVINDLKPANNSSSQDQFPLHLSIVAIALSVVSFGMQLRKK